MVRQGPCVLLQGACCMSKCFDFDFGLQTVIYAEDLGPILFLMKALARCGCP